MCLSYLFRLQSSALFAQLPVALACVCEIRGLYWQFNKG